MDHVVCVCVSVVEKMSLVIIHLMSSGLPLLMLEVVMSLFNRCMSKNQLLLVAVGDNGKLMALG
jgi:hypothetical protein